MDRRHLGWGIQRTFDNSRCCASWPFNLLEKKGPRTKGSVCLPSGCDHSKKKKKKKTRLSRARLFLLEVSFVFSHSDIELGLRQVTKLILLSLVLWSEVGRFGLASSQLPAWQGLNIFGVFLGWTPSFGDPESTVRAWWVEEITGVWFANKLWHVVASWSYGIPSGPCPCYSPEKLTVLPGRQRVAWFGSQCPAPKGEIMGNLFSFETHGFYTILVVSIYNFRYVV